MAAVHKSSSLRYLFAHAGDKRLRRFGLARLDQAIIPIVLRSAAFWGHLLAKLRNGPVAANAELGAEAGRDAIHGAIGESVASTVCHISAVPCQPRTQRIREPSIPRSVHEQFRRSVRFGWKRTFSYRIASRIVS